MPESVFTLVAIYIPDKKNHQTAYLGCWWRIGKIEGLSDIPSNIKFMRIRRTHTHTNGVSCSQDEAVDLSLIDPVISRYKDKKGNMIPLLQGVQNTYGYLPKEAFLKLASETGLKLSDMYGVATFYAQFRLKPVGKNIIKVCHGTACHVQNAPAITESLEGTLSIKNGETTPDKMFTLESVACLGCCSLAPVMMIGEDTHGKLTGKNASKIIKDISSQEKVSV
jgi:NADH-quinone oxidoreductase subunit E